MLDYVNKEPAKKAGFIIRKELIMLEIIGDKEGIRYPVARRDPESGLIVLFFSEKHGVVISTTERAEVNVGEITRDWVSCTNSKDWEPVDITITG